MRKTTLILFTVLILSGCDHYIDRFVTDEQVEAITKPAMIIHNDTESDIQIHYFIDGEIEVYEIIPALSEYEVENGVDEITIYEDQEENEI